MCEFWHSTEETAGLAVPGDHQRVTCPGGRDEQERPCPHQLALLTRRVGGDALAGDRRVGDPCEDHPLIFQALEPLQGPDMHSVVPPRPVRAD